MATTLSTLRKPISSHDTLSESGQRDLVAARALGAVERAVGRVTEVIGRMMLGDVSQARAETGGKRSCRGAVSDIAKRQ